MKELFDFSVFSDEGVSESAQWYCVTRRSSVGIRVIFTSEPFIERPSWEALEPEVMIHEDQGAVAQGDRLTILGKQYEVRDISPPDSEGFMSARLIRESR
jgi:hypothetical protein